MRKSAYIASIIISTTLGAGFISGKEIFVFFGFYNNYLYALIGFLFFALFFSIFIYKLLSIIYTYKICSYSHFNEVVMDNLSKISQIISIIFMFVIFSTMLSAGIKSIETVAHIRLLSMMCFVIPIFMIFLLESEGILSLSAVLTPIMIVGIIFLGIYTFVFQTVETANILNKTIRLPFLIILNSLVYVSYNSITLIGLMANLGEYLETKKVCLYSSILSSAILMFLGIIICMPLIKNYEAIVNVELPFLEVLKDTVFLRYIYTFVLLMAIFTTAISSGFSLIKFIENKYKINGIILKLILIGFGLIFSKIGFSNMVSLVYPFFGFLGFIQIYKILVFK